MIATQTYSAELLLALPPMGSEDGNVVNNIANWFTAYGESICGKSGATDDDLVGLLEASRIQGQWHSKMLAATAIMIGRGWDKFTIRLSIAQFCEGGLNDKDIGPLIDKAYADWHKDDFDAAAQSIPPTRRPTIMATQYVWKNPEEIARRQWLYGNHLIRDYASTTIAQGGVGKSALVLTEAIAMAAGRNLLGTKPTERCKVWYWNGEDPVDEIDRRIAAICIWYNIEREDIEGWLFTDSGRDQEIVIATQTNSGAVIAEPVVKELIETLRKNAIDVFIVDPFISTHQVTENDNNAIDLVAKKWAKIAGIANCAVDLIHHTRKTYGAELTVEDGRGASALHAAVRSARVLNVMTDADANKFGVEQRRAYFKVENGKSNLSPPPDAADWFHFEPVSLGNGPANNVLEGGDSVGVVTKWKVPDPLDGVTGRDFEKAATAIRGGEWRADPQAKSWVGHAVATALCLDIAVKSKRAKVAGLIKIWIASGSLIVVDGEDEKRNPRKFVQVKTDDD